MRLVNDQAEAAGSHRKRRAAAAGGLGVGIADHELRAFHSLGIVNLGAGQILKAHGVDQELHAAIFNHGVALADLFIKGKAILKTGAAAAGDKYPEHQGLIALIINQLFDLDRRRFAENQRVGHGLFRRAHNSPLR